MTESDADAAGARWAARVELNGHGAHSSIQNGKPMKNSLIAFILAAIVAQPALAFAEEFRSGDRVEGTAVFFMCGARDDLEAMKALDRHGDRETALKLGMDRCEPGRPGYHYIVIETKGDAVCLRRDANPYCLWALASSLNATPSQ
jgi:hypothetical protein